MSVSFFMCLCMDDGCQLIKTIKLVCYCFFLYFFCLCHIFLFTFFGVL
jgi:hypothetical protein